MKYIYFLDVNSRVITIQKRKFLKVLFSSCITGVDSSWKRLCSYRESTVFIQERVVPDYNKTVDKNSSHQQRFGSRIHFKAVPDPDPCPHWALVESGSRRLKKTRKILYKRYTNPWQILWLMSIKLRTTFHSAISIKPWNFDHLRGSKNYLVR